MSALGNTLFSPSEICDEILKKVTTSNLNYILKETPYSVNISLRKWLKKTIRTENCRSQAAAKPASQNIENQLNKEENASIRRTLKDSEKENMMLRNTIEILEEKVGKSEAAFYENMKKTRHF